MGVLDNLSFNAMKNVLLSCLFCFFTGFLYSLGVFTPFVEKAANPPGCLDSDWSSAMGLLSAFSIPAMFFGGIYLSQGTTHHGPFGTTKTSRARIMAATGSLSYGLLAVGGYGVAIGSPLLIRLAFVSVGIGYGLIFLQSMELLAVWVPHRPGLAVGIGQMTYGLGSIFASSVYNSLLQTFPTPNALYMAASMMFLFTATATPLIQWPNHAATSSDEEAETDPLIETAETTPLTMKELSHRPSFWMYFISIFCLRAGMAFIAYFFKIGETFGQEVSTLVTSFQVATIVGTLSRPLTGALVDILKTKEGFFSLGSKNMILILALIQAASFLALAPVSSSGSYVGFAFFAGVIQVIFAAGSCCAPLLAREQFGAVNSCVVYGTGGSLSMGLGEIFAVGMMAIVDKSAGTAATPDDYQGYYVLSFVWSIFGLIASVMLRAEEFENDSSSVSSSDSIESPRTSYDGIASS